MDETIKNFPWVFWFNISLRPDWFSYWWKTRGANFLEYQIWIFKISIGRPWKEHVLLGYLNDYNNLKIPEKTNEANLNPLFSFKIGKTNRK